MQRAENADRLHAYIRQENAHASRIQRTLQPRQRRIAQELENLNRVIVVKDGDAGDERVDGWSYRTNDGQTTRHGYGRSEILLDERALPKNITVGTMHVCPRHDMFAWIEKAQGDEAGRLRVKRLSDGVIFKVRLFPIQSLNQSRRRQRML
jgi:protease II